MDRWEYKHVWITTPLGREGEDVEESAMATLNRHGAEGSEVCSLLEYQQYWLVLIKRKVA
jgi:hypothetical protein